MLRSKQATGTASLVEVQISIVWVCALQGALRRCGFDGGALFEGMPLSPSLLGDVRARISLATWHALVRRALALTRDHGLALTVAGSAPESMLQITGQLALASETLRDALRTFEHYHAILADVRLCNLVEEGERAYIVYAAPPSPDAALARFDAELTLGLMYRVALHFLRPHGADITEIWLAHPEPAYAWRYGELFRCPVRFDRPRSALALERSGLDYRQPYTDRWFIDLLRACAEQALAAQRSSSLPDQVRALLRHGVDLRGVTAASVAPLLELDARRLRYLLLRSNVHWSTLVDETRREIACDVLRRGDSSLGELAERLGFAEQSAFNRAFKRWTGTTPARYGRRARAASKAA